MRTALDSPFSPGADTVPEVWAGRTSELSDWKDVVRPRRLAGEAERGRTILGEPGLGKSSLVRRIALEAESRGDWVTPQLRIALGTDPIKALAKAMLDLAAKAGLPARREAKLREVLARAQQVSVSGASVALRESPGSDPHASLTELLVEIGREARKQKDTMVFIHLDEIQNITSEEALSQLLISLGDALGHQEDVTVPGGGTIRRALPIAVYLTGLPEFEERAGARHGATFARRFQTMMLAPLSDADLELALAEFLEPGWSILQEEGLPTRVRMEEASRELLVELCCGEPFIFQLAGARAWNAGSSDLITVDDVQRGWAAARDEAESHVVRILERLPPKEREFIDVMTELDPADRTLSKIADGMGYAKATTAGPVAQRLDRTRALISRGRPYSFKHRAVEAYLTTAWPETE